MNLKKKAHTGAVLLLVSAMTAGQLGAAYGAQGPGILSGGSWKQEGADWRYRSSDGTAYTGWIKTASGWYYLDPQSSIMQTGWLSLDDGKYYLNTKEDGLAGQMRTGWYMNPAGKWYFFSTASDGSEGMMLTGWQWIDGYCYYFEPTPGSEQGVMYANAAAPDGSRLNADGRWTDADGTVQYIKGKGYQTAKEALPQTSAQSVSIGGGGSSGGSGGSSGGGSHGNGGSTGETEKPGSGTGTTNPEQPGGGNETTDPEQPGNGGGTVDPEQPGGGNGTVEPEHPGNAASLVDETLTRVTEINSLGRWICIVFDEAYDLSNTRVFADGTDVTDALSPVTDDGSIAKLALTGTPHQLVVQSADAPEKSETIQLDADAADVNTSLKETASAVYDGTGYLPEKILTHGAIPIWDYHLTNYDDDGNVRVSPEKTTFQLNETAEAHPAYAPDTILPEEGTAEVEIMFNYNTPEERAWFDGIEQLELVSYDERKDTLNDALVFDRQKDVSHGTGKVGILKIRTGQSNFYSNMRYLVRVKSKAGSTALVPIHLVQAKKPVLKLRETPQSGLNLHFTVSDMTYGITDPIERVELKDPTGTVHELKHIDDYFLYGDLFVLYNDIEAENGTNHLAYQGTYELKIYANGFQPFGKTFQVAKGEKPPVEKQQRTNRMQMGIDMLSSASVGGGSTEGGTSGGAMTSANLIFDTDLLVNAFLLEETGKANDASEKVLDWWYEMICDAVYDAGDEDFYDWTEYVDTVESIKTEEGCVLPFAEYRESGILSPNHPASAKEVLEDGLLGEVQTNGSFSRLDAPGLEAVQNEEGKPIILHAEDSAYIGAVTGVFLNNNWQAVDSSKYEVDQEKGEICLDASLFTPGERYQIGIEASGYKMNLLQLTYDKKLETDLSLAVNLPDGADAFQAVWNEALRGYFAKAEFTVKASDGDFLTALSSVKISDRTIYTKGVEGSSAPYYEVGQDKKRIFLYNIAPGQYELELRASYYTDALTASFEVTEEETEPEKKELPEAAAFTEVEPTWAFEPAYYRISFKALSDEALKAYLEAMETVTVGGTAYEKKVSFGSADENVWRVYASDSTGSYSDYDVLDLTAKGTGFSDTENTEIVLEAAGYEPLSIIVGPDKQLAGSTQEKPAPELEGALKVTEGNELVLHGDETYLAALTAVKNIEADEELRFETDADQLRISTENLPVGEKTKLELIAEGYEPQQLTVLVKEAEAAEEISVKRFYKEPGVFSSGYYVEFDGLKGEALTAYLNQIKMVTVGGEAYTKTNSSIWMSDNEYSLKASDDTQGMSAYDILNLAKNGFSDTEDTEVVIEADGYPTVSFVVDKEKKLKKEAAKDEAVQSKEETAEGEKGALSDKEAAEAPETGAETGTGEETGAGADVSTEADANANENTNANGNTNADANTDADTNADGNADADAEEHTDAETGEAFEARKKVSCIEGSGSCRRSADHAAL